jgi:DNA mismatch repair protein MutS
VPRAVGFISLIGGLRGHSIPVDPCDVRWRLVAGKAPQWTKERIKPMIVVTLAMEFARSAPLQGMMTPTKVMLGKESFMSSSAPIGIPDKTRKERGGVESVAFGSILFDDESDRARAQVAMPLPFFVDLNLDQIVDAIQAERSGYPLRGCLCLPLGGTEAVRYRHEVFRDLEDEGLMADVELFAKRMRDVRERLERVAKLYYRHHKTAWFLSAVTAYGETVLALAADLRASMLSSAAFAGLRDYLAVYVCHSSFTAMLAEAERLRVELAQVRYAIMIQDNAFTVRPFASEPDYSQEIEETFAKFQQGAAKDYRVKYRSDPAEMNHIEAKVLDFVAELHPALFSELDAFCARHASFVDKTMAAFDREVQFYLAYLDYIAPLKEAGLPFCYPVLSASDKEVRAQGTFDLALGRKLAAARAGVVCNDFTVKGKERIIVVTGPNQGGKTTFARMFGQLHYLASLGCPVPGGNAQLFLADQIFTHFERAEKVESLRGKLEDDLRRVHAILRQATSRSIIVMNEIFTSTTLGDEIFLSRKIMTKLLDLEVLCVWVTFVDELASFDGRVVSMVSMIDSANPALRTFRIERRPADGLAYALAIADKYRLTRDRLRERLAS